MPLLRAAVVVLVLTLAAGCADRGEEADVLVLGTAAKGVVLGPQDDGDVCQWIDYAAKLAGQYRVALYD